MEDDLSLHLQSVWQSSKIGFYCLNAAASAELVEIFFLWSVWLGQSGAHGENPVFRITKKVCAFE